MPRTLTIPAIRQSQREHGDDPFLVLLTIEVDAPGEFVHIVNNTEDIVSRGVTFIGCPFSLALPDITDYALAEATLAVDNVDPRIWKGIRLLNGAPTVLIEVILASDPDTPMLTTAGLKLREANADSQSITGKLVPDTVWQAGFPAHDFDPSQNPGMFGT
jgi:hypothetical protein